MKTLKQKSLIFLPIIFLWYFCQLKLQHLRESIEKVVSTTVKPVEKSKIISSKSIHFNPDLEMDKFLDELMSKMTLIEKLGQLNLPTAGDFTTGQAKVQISDKNQRRKSRRTFNIKGVDKIREVQRMQ